MSNIKEVSAHFEYIGIDNSDSDIDGRAWLVRFKQGSMVGWIKRLAHTRGYYFIPSLATTATALPSACLRDLADFCERETKEWLQEARS